MKPTHKVALGLLCLIIFFGGIMFWNFNAANEADLPSLGDSYNLIAEKYGQPIADLGSGVRILVYAGSAFGPTKDNASYILYFTMNDTLHRVVKKHSDNTETIILDSEKS